MPCPVTSKGQLQRCKLCAVAWLRGMAVTKSKSPEATVRHTHEDNSFLYFMESLRRGTARCAAKSMNRSVQKPCAPDTRWVTHPPQLLRGLDAHKTSSGECRFPTSRSGTPIIRHSPDSRVVERDFPSHRGVPQRNSIATASVRSQIAGLPASQCWNSLLCLHQGAPLPSPSVASDPHLPVMPVPVAPAAGRSTTGFPGTSALAPRPRPFGRLRSGRG